MILTYTTNNQNMLSIIAAKFLLKGAIKTLVVDPAISATISMIPKSSLVQCSLFGKDIAISTSDLIKFGMDKLYEKFGEQELTYRVDRVSNHMYQIFPANELAALFFKEYTGTEDLLVDLNTVDKYLDLLLHEDLEQLEQLEKDIFSQDEAILQILHDMDEVIGRVKPNQLASRKKEEILIDEVLKQNIEIVNKSTSKKTRAKFGPKSATDAILQDFPEPPFEPQTDEEKIEKILRSIGQEVKDKKKIANRSRTKYRMGQM